MCVFCCVTYSRSQICRRTSFQHCVAVRAVASFRCFSNPAIVQQHACYLEQSQIICSHSNEWKCHQSVPTSSKKNNQRNTCPQLHFFKSEMQVYISQLVFWADSESAFVFFSLTQELYVITIIRTILLYVI